MAAMQLTTTLVSGEAIVGDQLAWLRLIIGFDIIFTSLAVLLIDTVLIG
jgi:hypothetical protein